jgi:hypothetical protein
VSHIEILPFLKFEDSIIGCPFKCKQYGINSSTSTSYKNKVEDVVSSLQSEGYEVEVDELIPYCLHLKGHPIIASTPIKYPTNIELLS